MSRIAHLVGSIPLESGEAAMTAALDRMAPALQSLPDGETGERANWIIHIIEAFRDHPDLELKRQGDWSDYNATPVFRVRNGHTLRGESLDFGHVDAFEQHYPLFLKLREQYGRDDLTYQVGIPGDFDMALFTLGPTGPFRQRKPFTEATLREIRAIHDRAGDDVVFQIEVPAELVFVARMPAPLQPAMAKFLAGGIARLAEQSPVGARFGVHLCLGDMNHRALGRMTDVAPLVRLSNAVVDAWPSGRPLEFIHAPFAAAIEPPVNSRRFYAPLRDLRLPRNVEFIAGFAHEDQPLHAQVALRDYLDELTGREVGIATACGLGRRDRDAAVAAMDRTAALVNGTTAPTNSSTTRSGPEQQRAEDKRVSDARTSDADAERRGLELVESWATRHGLQRTDVASDVSARWGFSRRDTVAWCFPDSSPRRGLELWLKKVGSEEYDRIHQLFSAVGATQPSDPHLSWQTVVDHWDALEPALDAYLDAYKRVDEGNVL